MNEWKKCEIWEKRGSNFLVEIKRWNYIDLVNIWNVYVYIYPQHPMFDNIQNDKISSLLDVLGGDLNEFESYFHGRITYNEWYYKNQGIICKKIGSDYRHVGDDRFATYSTLDEAFEVKKDAEILYDYMEKKNFLDKIS